MPARPSAYTCQSPVLLIAFNRPDETRQVFENIRKGRVKKLYLALDGPRPGNLDDVEKQKEIRAIFDQVDWDCEVHTRYSEKNYGCGMGPYHAIRWAMEQEEYLIILEDDCVPSLGFFRLCDSVLPRYRNDTRISTVSGQNLRAGLQRNDDSYYFCRYGHSWGWATWRRVFEWYDFDMKTWPEFRDKGFMHDCFDTKDEVKYWTNVFQRHYTDFKEHSWDAQFMFAILQQCGLAIMPSKNLVTNIGIEGVHNKEKKYCHFIPGDDDYTVEKHPRFVVRNRTYDHWDFYNNYYRNKRLDRRIKRKFMKILRALGVVG